MIGHQILSIQRAIQAGMVNMMFEDSDVKINPGCAVFVTTESLQVREATHQSRTLNFNCSVEF